MKARKLETTRLWAAHQLVTHGLVRHKPKRPHRAVQKRAAEKRLMAVLDEDTLRLLAGGTPCAR